MSSHMLTNMLTVGWGLMKCCVIKRAMNFLSSVHFNADYCRCAHRSSVTPRTAPTASVVPLETSPFSEVQLLRPSSPSVPARALISPVSGLTAVINIYSFSWMMDLVSWMLQGTDVEHPVRRRDEDDDDDDEDAASAAPPLPR